MKNAYVVRGSEDGVIAVCGSADRAVITAVRYLVQGVEGEPQLDHQRIFDARFRVRQGAHETITESMVNPRKRDHDGVSVDIERFLVE